MPNPLDRLRIEALTTLGQVYDEMALRVWYTAHLSKKSPLMMALGGLGKLPQEQRVEMGKRGNEVKRALEAAFAEKEQAFQMAAWERSLKENAVDVTLPGRQLRAGHLHPVTQTWRATCAILARMG